MYNVRWGDEDVLSIACVRAKAHMGVNIWNKWAPGFKTQDGLVPLPKSSNPYRQAV